MTMSHDPSESREGSPSADVVMPTSDTEKGSSVRRMLWCLKLVQVRLRFLIVILIAAGIVSQWARVRSLWDRWIWNAISVTASSSVSGAHEYFCPMDPGVLSTWPAICPICNMDLVPRRKTDAQLLPEGVVARMQLTPYRMQLAGIRTVAVEARDLQFQISFTGILQSLKSGEGKPNVAGFEAFPSVRDAELFREPRVANVTVRSNPDHKSSAMVSRDDVGTNRVDAALPMVRIVVDDSSGIPVGSAVTAIVVIAASEVLAGDQFPVSDGEKGGIVCVPESAVVDRGDEHLVYVETMPGMFDGVAIKVGRRIGSYYPVLSGVKPGQRVAAAGAFLIDAETRLNPSLVAGYFGANTSARTSASATSPIAAIRRKNKAGDGSNKLSFEDQRLVDQQKICPVTKLSLDSMGGPIPVMIGDRRVFICCAGCEDRLRGDPERYLANLPKTE